MTSRRRLGPGPSLPDPAPRDPRARTIAERAADGEWVATDEPGRDRQTGRRPLGPGISDATAP